MSHCILAIETSCDDTSVAIVGDGPVVYSSLVASQIRSHRRFGGIVPELASRQHAETLPELVARALYDAQRSFSDITALAVTAGPGLEGSLLVGLAYAKTAASILNVPLVGVNHLHGHLYAPFLEPLPPAFPFISLVVSGGHTALVRVTDYFQFEELGRTRDDAAGEAFDKVARMLGLSYPGGPEIEKQADSGNPKAFAFPKALLHERFEFSFSGLKTAVLNSIRQLEATGTDIPVQDICASFQACVIDTLWHKAVEACRIFQCRQLCVTGGVSANQALTRIFSDRAATESIRLFVPGRRYCTDNAAMIGLTALFQLQSGYSSRPSIPVQPSLQLCDLPRS